MKHFRIVITPGEPAGIGPEIVVRLAQFKWPFELVVCADPNLLKSRAESLKLPLSFLRHETTFRKNPQKTGTITILPVALRKPSIPGKLCVENSFYVIETLSRACDGCLKGEFSALVTGPVHKGIINEAGIPFSGHTEFLKERSHTSRTVMMLEGKDRMRVALVTTHQPIREIPNMITAELLREVITILHHDLRKKLGISQPRILVCGLNPHAGEGGHIGNEEICIIIPVLQEMRKMGVCIFGPLPADTIFHPKYLNHSDVILAMYHDQGLPVLKYQGFGHSVNITLGLPFIRTSVDHGTALSLAGKGKADINSFIIALNFAIKMIFNIYNFNNYE